MQQSGRTDEVVRFGVFEANRKTGELRKGGVRIRLQDQPFQILLMLLERPGEVLPREEIQKRLWPDGTFVEFEHSIGTAVKKLRQALGDDADTPRYIETLPKRGFRFIAPVETSAVAPVAPVPAATAKWPIFAAAVSGAVITAVIAWIYVSRTRTAMLPERTLTRLTFDSGLQVGPTWSPDGRFIAYSSDRSGKFDIWVQQVGGISPVKITARPGHNWQPDWSPDGSQIVFRSEGEDGGLFLVPALGGPERKIASFGYRPKWSPDGSWILFGNTVVSWLNKQYVVGVDGQPPREILSGFLKNAGIAARSVSWYPGSNRLSIFGYTSDGWGFWTVSMEGTEVQRFDAAPAVARQLAAISDTTRFELRWAASGRAAYVEGGESRGVRNLWKLNVDPVARRFLSMDRLTTGPGPDTDLSVSQDGKRLVYATPAERIRIWLFALNARTGAVSGDGQAVTPAAVSAWQADLSSDGAKLGYVVNRLGKQEVWTESLPNGPAALLLSDETAEIAPRWSPDAKRVAFTVHRGDTFIPMLLPEGGGSMQQLASPEFHTGFFDWSPDSQFFFAVTETDQSGATEYRVWMLPIAAAPHAETAAKMITASRSDYIDETRVSPNGRWLAFEGVRGGPGPGGAANAIIYSVALSGGPWTSITDGASWDDKPRWSLDGKLLYFVSSRSGFFNVWAVPFDPQAGRPLGKAFPITSFENPAFTIADDLGFNSLSLSRSRLAISIKESSGNIWMLDNVDQ